VSLGAVLADDVAFVALIKVLIGKKYSDYNQNLAVIIIARYSSIIAVLTVMTAKNDGSFTIEYSDRALIKAYLSQYTSVNLNELSGDICYTTRA
jgi:hypothetical protein